MIEATSCMPSISRFLSIFFFSFIQFILKIRYVIGWNIIICLFELSCCFFFTVVRIILVRHRSFLLSNATISICEWFQCMTHIKVWLDLLRGAYYSRIDLIKFYSWDIYTTHLRTSDNIQDYTIRNSFYLFFSNL